MHFLLYSMSVVYVLTTSILEDKENATMEQIRKRAKWENNDYVCRCLILNGCRIMTKPKGNNVVGPSVVNMMEHNNSFRKPEHLKKDCKGGKVGNKANGLGTNGSVDGSTNSLKGQNMFNKSLQ
nr:zinc finger, CCHC-type [Tanacetum cinerariifolium]GEW68537.1 zinc finger, CCHC-type [Tanacetum cinerariifolium]